MRIAANSLDIDGSTIKLKQGATGATTITEGTPSSAITLTLPKNASGLLVNAEHGGDATKEVVFDSSGATTAKGMTIASSHTDDRTLTLPDATDTLVGKATTDTLTNKTLTSPTLTTPAITSATLTTPIVAAGSTLTLDNQASIRFEDDTGDEYVQLQASTGTTTHTLKLPTTQGSADEVLSNDGSGNLSWVAMATANLTDQYIFVGGSLNTTQSVNTASAGDILVDESTGLTLKSGAVLTLPQINDTSSDHQYIVAVNELAADRTITLPLLLANDEVIFANHIATLTGKNIGDPSDNTKDIAFSLSGATTAKTLTIVSSHTDDRSVTFPDATTTLAGFSDKLSVFAATTSAELAGVISDETGSGALVFATSPTLVTPALGTPSSGVATNLTGLPLTTGVTGTLGIANGGTGQTAANAAFNALSPATTKGDLVGFSTVAARVAVGADGTVLKADSTAAEGVSWGTASSGSGEINYIDNPDAESDTSGWATYADAAAATPVDGTGGAPTVTITRQSGTILRGNQSFKITKDAADRQGEGASYDFSIKTQDISKKLKIQFDFKSDEDAAYAAGDLAVYIYDVTNSTLITPVDTDLISGQNIFQTSFNSSTSTSYRLIFHVASANASAWDVYIDNVIVGPGMVSQGAAVGGWNTYTPIWTGGSPAIGNGTLSGRWKRNGPNMEIKIGLVSGTTTTYGSSSWDFSLPSGYTIDTDQIIDTTAGREVLGSYSAEDNGGNYYAGSTVYGSTTTLKGMTNSASDNVSGVSPFTPTASEANNRWFFIASVPIAEWAGKGIVPMLAQDNLSEWQAYTPTIGGISTSSSAGFWRQVGSDLEFRVYGALSSTASSAITFGLPSGLTINTAVLATSGVLANHGTAMAADATASAYFYGIVTAGTANTNVRVIEDGAGAAGDYWGSSNQPFIWASGDSVSIHAKVPIVEFAGSQNSLVGYSMATQSYAGLVKLPSSHVRVTSGNGHGSTNTKIRRFNTTEISTGSDITYADSAADGGSFTINTAGLYSVSYIDSGTDGNQINVGASVNSAQLTTDVESITYTDRLFYTNTRVGWTQNNFMQASTIRWFSAGDIIRAHTNANGQVASDNRTVFEVVKIA